jgi:hypothetical protein
MASKGLMIKGQATRFDAGTERVNRQAHHDGDHCNITDLVFRFRMTTKPTWDFFFYPWTVIRNPYLVGPRGTTGRHWG